MDCIALMARQSQLQPQPSSRSSSRLVSLRTSLLYESLLLLHLLYHICKVSADTDRSSSRVARQSISGTGMHCRPHPRPHT